MKKKLALALVTVLVLSLAFTGCAPKVTPSTSGTTPAPTAATEPLKVGFIYVGPIGDGGYTYAHDQGRLMVEKELGAAVKTVYKESVPESAECEKAIKDMIDQGCKMIFATSFGHMDFVEKVSKEFPDVKFFHCSGYKSNTTNFVNYFAAMEEPRYLSGIVAGMKTKNGKIGFVGAYEIPEVVRGINAFTLGVQSVNPTATVEVKWTHTWYDPAKEKDAAKALLAQGCDVIAQHQDTAGPIQAAEEAGKFAIGYNTDMKDKGPNSYMTAPMFNWGPYYVSQVKAVVDGTWKAENYYGHMVDKVVLLAPLTKNAPDGAQAKVDEMQAKIIDGSYKVFTGPIKDQAGKEMVAAGVTLPLDKQLSMDWFVQGVIGKVK